MPTDSSAQDTPQLSKLALRGKLLAIIQQFTAQEPLSSAARQQAVESIKALTPQRAVAELLVKELVRAASQREHLDIIAELITLTCPLQWVQKPLWQLIEDPKQNDLLKDTANMVLRQLGDKAEPEKYMHYLKNPEQLIHDEMSRTLAMAMSDPQALVDFLDFIISLNTVNQSQLLDTLAADFDPKALAQLYRALLESQPNEALCRTLVERLGNTGDVSAAELLHAMRDWPASKQLVPGKLRDIALKKLQLAGVYHPKTGVVYPETRDTHPLLSDSIPHLSYATLPDGLGHQGLLLSRKHNNDSYSLLGIALHDTHGIIDCFGFLELSPKDLQRFVERFYDTGLKTAVPGRYVASKIRQAEAQNLKKGIRLPYEFRAWSVLLDDIPGLEADASETNDKTLAPWHHTTQWVRPDWLENTGQLYNHPEFRHCFIEYGDMPLANECLKLVTDVLQPEQLEKSSQDVLNSLKSLAEQLARILQSNTAWRERFARQLSETAWLLDLQHVETFRDLAATAAESLATASETPTAFTIAYAKRSVLEQVLRHYRLQENTDALQARWIALLPKVKKQLS